MLTLLDLELTLQDFALLDRLLGSNRVRDEESALLVYELDAGRHGFHAQPADLRPLDL